jgi:hypothetical protein
VNVHIGVSRFTPIALYGAILQKYCVPQINNGSGVHDVALFTSTNVAGLFVVPDCDIHARDLQNHSALG